MQPVAETDIPRREWLGDLWRIAFVMLLGLAVRSWIVAHTEVISRDGIGFIRFALQIESPPPSPEHPDRPMTRAEVLRASYQAPGYSASVLAVSWPVRWIMGGTTCDSMAKSAQVASILASLLLVIPMFYFGKLAFDRQTAFVGAMLFQVLPLASQVGSDGLSENLFLLFVMSAIWMAAVGFDRGGAGWFGAAGTMSGLAFLVRPEGLMAVVAIGLVLILSKLRGKIGWRAFCARGMLMLMGMLTVTAPYVATIGRPTNKPTGDKFFRWLSGEEWKPSWLNTSEAPTPQPPVAFPLAEWYGGVGEPPVNWACKALAN